jgi:hypothetical protein
MKLAILLVLATALSPAALAQTRGPFKPGQTLYTNSFSAPPGFVGLNDVFASKVDTTNGVLTNPVINGTSITGPVAQIGTVTGTALDAGRFNSAGIAGALGFTPPQIGTAAGTARDAAAAIAAEAAAQSTANAALPKAGGTMTGQLFATVVRLGSGNIVWNGAGSSLNSLIFSSNTESGSAFGSNQNFSQMQLTDTVNSGSTTMNDLFVFDSIIAPASGGRVAIAGATQFNGAGPIVGPTIGTLGQASMNAPSGGRVVRGWPYEVTGSEASAGGALGLWGLPSFNTTANGFQGEQASELDDSIAPGLAEPPELEFGLSVENITTATGPQAVYDDTAIQLGAIGHNYLCGFCAGSSTFPWPMDPSGTIFGAELKAYGGTSGSSALYGIDLRPVTGTTGGDAVALPAFGVDWSGNTDATSITTNGTVQAETAALTGVTINTVTRGSFTNTGGIYPTIPTFTVQAPPSGATATATVSAMAGNSILGFGSTGAGYSVNDQLTLVGGTGTAAVLNVLTVDGSGHILTYSASSPGSWTAAPANPVSVTGGTGAGATFEMIYTSSSGLYSLSGIGQFASTGAGYAVGNVITPTGDTGAEPTFTVASVTSTGGIMMPITATSGGSVAALASGTYHAVTGGAGSGASVQVGYGVSAFTTTPGSGYPAFPPPLIVGSETNWYGASLVAQMTPAATTLALQPSGGATTMGGTLVTTGTITASGNSAVSAGAFVPTSTVAHSVSIYLPVTSTMGFSTSSVPAGTIDPNQHWRLGNSTAPTIAANACGSTTQGTIVEGNDMGFEVLVGAASVTSCAVTFAAAFASTPRSVTFSPANSTAAQQSTTGAFVSAINPTTVVIGGLALAGAEYYVHVQ